MHIGIGGLSGRGAAAGTRWSGLLISDLVSENFSEVAPCLPHHVLRGESGVDGVPGCVMIACPLSGPTAGIRINCMQFHVGDQDSGREVYAALRRSGRIGPCPAPPRFPTSARWISPKPGRPSRTFTPTCGSASSTAP